MPSRLPRPPVETCRHCGMTWLSFANRENATAYLRAQGHGQTDIDYYQEMSDRAVRLDTRVVPEVARLHPHDARLVFCRGCIERAVVCDVPECAGQLHLRRTDAHPDIYYDCAGGCRQTLRRDGSERMHPTVHYGLCCCAGCWARTVRQCAECHDYYYANTTCPCLRAYAHGWAPSTFNFYVTKDTLGRAKDRRLYLGMELEVETPNAQAKVNKLVKESNLPLYAKTDGSLRCGTEIVSHPMTFQAWRDYWPELCELYAKLKELGVMAYTTDTCGLHIHAARRGFRSDAHLYRVGLLMYSNKDFIHELSQRDAEKLQRWAKLDDVKVLTPIKLQTVPPIPANWALMTYEQREAWRIRRDEIALHNQQLGKSLVSKIRHSSTLGWDRYTALNLTPGVTAEFRFFKGTIYAPAIMRALESIQAFRDFTLDVNKDTAAKLDAFKQYVGENKKTYPQLAAWISGQRDIAEQQNGY